MIFCSNGTQTVKNRNSLLGNNIGVRHPASEFFLDGLAESFGHGFYGLKQFAVGVGLFHGRPAADDFKISTGMGCFLFGSYF